MLAGLAQLELRGWCAGRREDGMSVASSSWVPSPGNARSVRISGGAQAARGEQTS